MFYKFPVIITLSEVKKALEGREDFFIKENGDITIVNYRLNTPSTFEDPNEPGITPEESVNRAIRKECRGMIFDTRYGGILSRPLHKFHNLNERPEYSFEHIDLSKKHKILEKLDGSMIRPYEIPQKGEIVWGTKMGHHTEVAEMATAFVKKNPKYIEFAELLVRNDRTPIFEFCSRKNRIVIDYPEDRMVLLAVRDNVTGEYYDYERLGALFDIETVKSYEFDGFSFEDIVKRTRLLSDSEGVIVRFDNGHMVKIKADHYCLLHKTKEQFGLEKNVLATIMNEGLDDLLPLLDSDLKDKLSTYSWKVSMGITNKALIVQKFVEEHKDLSQKDFADKVLCIHPELSSMMFKVRSGNDAFEVVANYVKKNTSSKTSVDKIRFIINTIWNEYEIEE